MIHMQGNGVRMATNQVQFSLLYRRFEKDGLLDAAKEMGISIIAYSPLAQGLLSGARTYKSTCLSTFVDDACLQSHQCAHTCQGRFNAMLIYAPREAGDVYIMDIPALHVSFAMLGWHIYACVCISHGTIFALCLSLERLKHQL